MPRSRNIKHSFFTNDKIAELAPIERLAFIGLWTLADYKGEIEWRAKRIKAMILPYDNCDLDEIAINLEKHGFIRTYSVQGVTYIHIVNFLKHQNPHKNEKAKGSDIPAFVEQAVDSIDVTINRDKNGTAPADSCFLIPDNHPTDEGLQPSVWDRFIKLTGNPKSRSYLGKLIKDHGEDAVTEAVEMAEAKMPADPVSYISGILRKPPDKEEIEAYIVSKGFDQELARMYVNSRESTGWKRKGERIVNWKPDAENYIRIYMEQRQ